MKKIKITGYAGKILKEYEVQDYGVKEGKNGFLDTIEAVSADGEKVAIQLLPNPYFSVIVEKI